jgi:S1/P1 Nuclease
MTRQRSACGKKPLDWPVWQVELFLNTNLTEGRARARSLALRACLLAFCLLLPTVLLGWGSIGHMTVAYVAYQKLTPATKARVRDLLKLNPDFAAWEKQVPAGASADEHDQMIFMIAATWADDIKGDPKYSDDGPDPNTPDGATSSQNIGYSDLFRHRYWHFIDTPYYIDGTSGYSTPTPNAQTQIAAFRLVLASTQSDDLKSYDLVWLLHLIGDVHQPLHATTRVSSTEAKGDAGGNTVKLKGDAASNLHSYWDDLPGADCNFCNNKAHCVDRAVVLGKSLKAATVKASHVTDADKWLAESFNDSRTAVYKAPIDSADGPYSIVPGSLYERSAVALANKRVALAGARLAEVLNSELK